MSQRKNSRDDHLLSKIVPKTEHPSLLKRKERELLQILQAHPHLPNKTNPREKEGGKGRWKSHLHPKSIPITLSFLFLFLKEMG
jgi:hypothetical protein